MTTGEIVYLVDALASRVEENEREHCGDVLSIRDEITVEVGTLQAIIDGLSGVLVTQINENRDLSRNVAAIIGGRLMSAVMTT